PAISNSRTAAQPGSRRAETALERARQARIERAERERGGGLVPADDAPPGGTATGRSRTGSGGRTVRSGPPALPVIVLVAVVVVLGIGATWLIATGEDSTDPASERSGAATTTTAIGPSTPTTVQTAASASNRASALTAVETGEGVQLDWEGPVGVAYLVRVLSANEPPRPLAAGPATALLVPSVSLRPQGPYCFDVVAAPEDGAPPITAPDDPDAVVLPTDCIRGATPQDVRRQ
ncbi:MAG TPA: hypothetical protein VF743_04530, partial [Acidimicrobiales bacterium]